MTPNDIINGMAEKNRMLTQKNDEYLTLVEKRAQAERAFNIAVARSTLEYKSVGSAFDSRTAHHKINGLRNIKNLKNTPLWTTY